MNPCSPYRHEIARREALRAAVLCVPLGHQHAWTLAEGSAVDKAVSLPHFHP